MSKPKVMLHIIMPNQISGPNKIMNMIANSSLKEKYDFCFLTQESLAGGRVNLQLITNLKRQIEKEKPDVVHLSGLQSSGFHAMLASRLAKCRRIVLGVHGFSGESLDLKPMKRFIFNYLAEPYTLRKSHAIYTVCKSASERPMIKKHAKNFCGYIHNFINVDQISSRERKKSIRTELNITHDEVIISTASRIVQDKGYEYLADAIKKINSYETYRKTAKFLIIGEGKYSDQLRNKLRSEIENENVYLLGKREDVIEILFESDVFVFPTLHENLSMALLEACFTGNAVIATRVGGNLEVIKHEFNGLLIPSKNSEALFLAIRKLIDDSNIRKKLADNAKQTILQRFSGEVSYKQIDFIYQCLLSGKTIKDYRFLLESDDFSNEVYK